jgi:nicotinate-nucleotide--dimethylbenzimidazole phosphoribosyltransferase
MSPEALVRALRVGAESVPEGTLHLFVGGEMGIGNTTAAAALISALLVLPPEMTVGSGTGVDLAGLARKRQAVESGLALHSEAIRTADSPALAALERLGGFEIAALTGAYIRCAQRGIGVLIDGYISTAAALCAVRINPQVRDWMLFGHVSAEPAHRHVLEHLGAVPLLNLGLRLGEGSGAALAVPLLQAALNLHNGMASFANAGVTNRE